MLYPNIALLYLSLYVAESRYALYSIAMSFPTIMSEFVELSETALKLYKRCATCSSASPVPLCILTLMSRPRLTG